MLKELLIDDAGVALLIPGTVMDTDPLPESYVDNPSLDSGMTGLLTDCCVVVSLDQAGIVCSIVLPSPFVEGY